MSCKLRRIPYFHPPPCPYACADPQTGFEVLGNVALLQIIAVQSVTPSGESVTAAIAKDDPSTIRVFAFPVAGVLLRIRADDDSPGVEHLHKVNDEAIRRAGIIRRTPSYYESDASTIDDRLLRVLVVAFESKEYKVVPYRCASISRSPAYRGAARRCQS